MTPAKDKLFKSSKPRYRCKICDEKVMARDRREHLIDHAPAYGSAADVSTGVTNMMFEKE